jgi:sortase A
MRLIFKKEPLRRLLTWSQGAFLACAVLLLGYCAFAITDAWLFQRRESTELERVLRDRRAVSEVAPVVETGSLIGRMEIPRLLLSVVVVEGVDETTLRRAAGHIPGTALPGETGNVGVAGHRDTFFRSLKNLRIKDEVQLSTPKGIFQYEVVSLKIVKPDNLEVLAPSGENGLTLVTCYPFYFVGPAPKRWIVTAKQVSSQAMSSSSVK